MGFFFVGLSRFSPAAQQLRSQVLEGAQSFGKPNDFFCGLSRFSPEAQQLRSQVLEGALISEEEEHRNAYDSDKSSYHLLECNFLMIDDCVRNNDKHGSKGHQS